MTGLTVFQAEVARLFFSLPASEGFLLAGGGALLVTGLSTRPTEDLDFFGVRGRSDVTEACAQLRDAVAQRQWTIDTLHESDTFVRLRVVASDTVLVDVAIDVAPGRPPLLSVVGPTFDLEELAGRKLLALFDRAQARDFVDVYALLGRFGAQTSLARAAEVDLGFDRGVLAAMIRTMDRYRDDDLPVTDTAPAVLRAFFTAWANDLEAAT